MILKMALFAGVLVTFFSGVAQAATKFAIKDSSGVEQFTVSDSGVLNRLLTSGWIGVGTTTPLGPFHFQGSGNTVSSGGFLLQFTNTGTLSPIKAPNISLRRNNDPALWAGGLPRKDDILGMFQFGTVVDTYGVNMASLSVRAEENATSTLAPAYIVFHTTHDNAGVSQLSEKLRISSIGNVGIGATGPTQKLEVNGGVRLNTVSARPSCDATVRGTIWIIQGGSGEKDSIEVCAKDAIDTYGWRQIY